MDKKENNVSQITHYKTGSTVYEVETSFSGTETLNKKIIVHVPDKSNGHRFQKVQIVFSFIGEFVPSTDFVPYKKFPQDYF